MISTVLTTISSERLNAHQKQHKRSNQRRSQTNNYRY